MSRGKALDVRGRAAGTFAFAGTPEHVAAQVGAVIAAGAGRVDFGTPHGLTGAGGVTLLGARVLPLLRGSLPAG